MPLRSHRQQINQGLPFKRKQRKLGMAPMRVGINPWLLRRPGRQPTPKRWIPRHLLRTFQNSPQMLKKSRCRCRSHHRLQWMRARQQQPPRSVQRQRPCFIPSKSVPFVQKTMPAERSRSCLRKGIRGLLLRSGGPNRRFCMPCVSGVLPAKAKPRHL